MQIAFIALVLVAVAATPLQALEPTKATTPSEHVLFPALTAQDTNGHRVPLLSLEAFRAEFRHLRRVLREIDLRGPAIVTDGWSTNGTRPRCCLL